MNNSQFEQHLQQQIDSVEREQQPQRDLWPGIDTALTGVERHQSSRIWLSSAAALLVVGLVGWMMLRPALNPNMDDLVTALSQRHQQQVKSLLVAYADEPALTDNWQQQMQQLDDAAKAIKIALKQAPDNPELLNMLRQVYQQQIDLIEKVHAPSWQQI